MLPCNPRPARHIAGRQTGVAAVTRGSARCERRQHHRTLAAWWGSLRKPSGRCSTQCLLFVRRACVADIMVLTYGIGDAAIGVATVSLPELLDALIPRQHDHVVEL